MIHEREEAEKARLENIENMHRDYQALFSGPTGRRVLTDIMVKNYLFGTIETEEQRIRHNVAVEILQSAGLLHVETLKPIIESIVKVGRSYPLITKKGT